MRIRQNEDHGEARIKVNNSARCSKYENARWERISTKASMCFVMKKRQRKTRIRVSL